MRTLVIERSDWFTVDAADAIFCPIEDGNNEQITGEQWLDLDDDQRSNYMLMTDDAYSNALDGETVDFTVEEYDDPMNQKQGN